MNGLPSYEEKSIIVDGVSMNYYEHGSGPVILYLHGIPTSGFLWRNVLPITSMRHRSIAVDLAGYGKSGLPKNQDYSTESQYKYLEKYIEVMGLKNITLVVNDLGSILGLRYAINHSSNIKNIVYIEAVFMPSVAWYKQLPLMQRIMFQIMKYKNIAEYMIVKKNNIPNMVFDMGIKRKLSKEELSEYQEIYNKSIEHRKILLDGPGPAQILTLSLKNWIDTNAQGLKNLDVPMLLLTGNPGMITQKGAITYAKKYFKNISIIPIGDGIHFLPEDEPINIAHSINAFMENHK